MSRAKVLILCTGNSARSQMAEGLLRHHAGDHFEVYSAGFEPKGVHPLSIQAMEEVGIDIRGHESTDATEYLGHLSVNYLITVCDNAQMRCPTAWPGIWDKFHWSVDDPAAVEGDDETRLAAFRLAREDLDTRIRDWIASEPWTWNRGRLADQSQQG